MKSNADLLNMYKEEKALVIGGPDERTGLEDFPSFKEWKAEYVKEYNETHVTVTVEEADKLAEEAIEEADEMVKDDPTLPVEDEEDDMTDETTPEAVEAAPATDEPAAEAAPAKPKRTAKKKTAVKKVAATRAPKTKAREAQKVFDRMYPKVLEGKKARKDVIDALVDKVGLTANGAATYYQKMKKAAG